MIRIDLASPVPPTEQVRQQLAGLIRSGALAEGERLPSVRQLAADLGVANGTVAKAYKELEVAGLVSTGRAAGTRVSEGQASAADLGQRVRRLVADARLSGLGLDELTGLVSSEWAARLKADGAAGISPA